MDIERGRIINDFIEPNKKQYVIPVYQRNYEWSREQCVKLFEDIVNAYKKDKLHFCGSVVYAPLEHKHGIDYYVIVDGQQRLTTIYLLIKALIDCAETASQKEYLSESVFNKDKFDTYDVEEASKLKLKPIKSDNQQLYLLMDNKYDQIDKSSGIWENYSIFKEQIQDLLNKDPDIDVKMVYKGIEKLICAKIRLEKDDNAQEIFERINSTGVPLSLSDQIRNYVLMTDVDQDKLYEDYWIKVEELVSKENMSAFFMDYLNLKLDGFTRENQAYEDFKKLFAQEKFTNEGILKEVLHYAQFYNIFLNGGSDYTEDINESLDGLKLLNQTTVYLFLFRVFDDYANGIIDKKELGKVLRMLQNYSIRRIMCDISSNSLRGLYKTLYNRVFNQPENKTHYYDSVVSFMIQMTSRDAIPTDDDFEYALKNNNLYRKHALCRYLLIGIENQGKEKVVTDSLSIEHVMPQNKNLSTSWQKMLGDNWAEDKDRWLHTLGNLTLTGYNSELGDRPFLEKKKMIEDNQTKIVNLYKDIQDKQVWNAKTIQDRADRLAKEVMKLYPIEKPSVLVSFSDPRYKEYTCAEPSNATYKTVNYYELEGERVITDSFAVMVRSVAKKLYEKNPAIIERMARNLETFTDWTNPVFSYDPKDIKGDTKIEGTSIYISTGYSAYDCISFIRGMLRKYDLDIEEDFVYSARSNKADSSKENSDTEEEGRKAIRMEYWQYALPIIQLENAHRQTYSNCRPGTSNEMRGSFGISGFDVRCIANYDMARIDFWLGSSNQAKNKEAYDILFAHKDDIEKELGVELSWSRADEYKASWIIYHLYGVSVTNQDDWEKMAHFHAEWSNKICNACLPYLEERYSGKATAEEYRKARQVAEMDYKWAMACPGINVDTFECSKTYIRFGTPFMDSLIPPTEGQLSEWSSPCHYYYEIRNYDGKAVRIQLSFNSKNLPDDQRKLMDRIVEEYPVSDKENWHWRLPYATKKVDIPEELTQENVNTILDGLFADILKFESDLKNHLNQ